MRKRLATIWIAFYCTGVIDYRKNLQQTRIWFIHIMNKVKAMIATEFVKDLTCSFRTESAERQAGSMWMHYELMTILPRADAPSSWQPVKLHQQPVTTESSWNSVTVAILVIVRSSRVSEQHSAQGIVIGRVCLSVCQRHNSRKRQLIHKKTC